MAGFDANDLSAAFVENRGRLLQLVRRRLNPVLLKRFDPEDVLSAAYENAAKRHGECAAVFGIDQKAASIRHVRALERLQKRLMEYSCFGNETPHGRG